MRRETAIILLLISLVVLPVWYVAMTSGAMAHHEEVVLRPMPNESLNALGHFAPMPVETGIYRSGVVTWIALFALMGILLLSTRYLRRVGREGDAVEGEATADLDLPPYLTKGREVVAYWTPSASIGGVWLVGIFALLDVAFASLLASEVLGMARTQFIGLYAGLLTLSLGETVMLYYAHFVPSIDVVEARH
ncbi:hypothetical protein [Halospeciosus flavus]|uniref:Uncharacterized protein n=1 Tax=Halospeciosus flavus TaxID=3032283 RepID=A0ABD5Z789_9EURY|nr:hypothetical protein [Halospeciosus flavus]